MYRVIWAFVCACLLHAQSGQSPQDLLREAVSLHQAGKLDEAIRDYRAVLDAYPNMAQVRSNLGAALVGAGRYDEAIVEYNRALEIAPDPHVRLNLALAYYKASRLPEAVSTLIQIREQEPANLQAVMVLADCYLQMGKNKDVAELLEPLHRGDPSNLAVDYMLGTALVRDGQTAQGQLVIDQILKVGDSAEARLLMGTTKFMVKDFSGALVDLEKAVALNPKLPDVYSYYGLALLSTGDQAGAKTAFQHELEQNPNNFEANLRLGVLLRQDDDNEGAMKDFQHARQLRPQDFAVRYQIGAAELAMGEIDKARDDLESLVKDAPTFTEAHVTLATIYYRQKRKADGDKERAIVEALNVKRQAAEPAAKTAQ